jgi:hypothetical protein
MNSLWDWGPREHHKTFLQEPIGLKPRLGVDETVILLRESRALKHQRRIKKIQASLSESSLPLLIVECDFHSPTPDRQFMLS